MLDMNTLLSTSTTIHMPPQGMWTSHEPLLSKLRSFIPRVLSELELQELDPQQSSQHHLSSLMFEELVLHNRCTAFLLASLQVASSCLQGQLSLSTTVGRTLTSLASDAIPASWAHHLPQPLGHMTSLMSALKLLRARMEFYRRTLHSGTLPSKLNPLLFSTPQNLISSRGCVHAAECQLSVSSIVIEGKVCTFNICNWVV